MAKSKPAELIRQVRQEASKVTWPSRKETMVTTVMVFIFVVLSALFFLGVDWMLSSGVKVLVGLWGE
ncbi:MAG: preprotein translocase subunit SecE [Sphingomonadales bacterium]